MCQMCHMFQGSYRQKNTHNLRHMKADSARRIKALIDWAQFDQYCDNIVTISMNLTILDQYCDNIGQIEPNQSAPLAFALVLLNIEFDYA